MNNAKVVTLSDLLVEFIKENFITGRSHKNINPDESLIDSGIIDSTGILELVMFLEEKFLITIEDEDLIPENLDTINNIIKFLKRKGIRQ